MDDLAGKVVVITGATRGIGLAIAEAFAAHGSKVLVIGRNQESCDEVAARLTEAYGVDAVGMACHVGRWDDCTALVDKLDATVGKVDVLINNAGMSPVYSSLDEVSETLFDKVIGVNLRGPFRLAALLGERMKASRGSIINISSVSAVQPREGELVYAAAKAGLNALSLGLAQAYAPHVRVNTIMPGPFLTDIAKSWTDEEREELTDHLVPLRRLGDPHEVAQAAVFLASEASAFTTGAVLKIDGGVAWAAS